MTSVSDDFNRANAANLGGNWTAFNSSTKILSNQAYDNVGSSFSFQRYSATALATSDQAVQAAVGTLVTSATSKAMYLFARLNACTAIANTTGYGAYLEEISGAYHGGIFKYVSGTLTFLGPGPGIAIAGTPAVNDVYRLEVSGSSVRALLNGTTALLLSDTSVAAGAYCGFGVTSALGAIGIDNWSAADRQITSFMNLLASPDR